MATQNAINTGKPIEVANGGTGAATLLIHGVLVGEGTSAVTALAVGTTGQLLVGTSSADPAFASSASGDFTFTTATASTTRTLTVSNTDNTSATSHALMQITTGGASSGDPATTYTITGATSWTTGADNSDSDTFKISQGTALGTNDVMKAQTTGEINWPLQSAFLGAVESADNNVTGDNTTYTIGTNVAYTTIFDQNSDFNTNGTFTAPVTGRYYLSAAVLMGGITAGMTTGVLQIVTTGNNFNVLNIGPAAAADASAQYGFHGAVFCSMTAADTAVVKIIISNGTKVADVLGADPASAGQVYFCGYLVC